MTRWRILLLVSGSASAALIAGALAAAGPDAADRHGDDIAIAGSARIAFEVSQIALEPSDALASASPSPEPEVCWLHLSRTAHADIVRLRGAWTWREHEFYTLVGRGRIRRGNGGQGGHFGHLGAYRCQVDMISIEAFANTEAPQD